MMRFTDLCKDRVKWLDVLYHAIGGVILSILMVAAIYIFGSTGLAIFLAGLYAGLLRELAQANKSNIFKAIQDMPTWGIRGHAEWIAWGVGGVIGYAVFT